MKYLNENVDEDALPVEKGSSTYKNTVVSRRHSDGHRRGSVAVGESSSWAKRATWCCSDCSLAFGCSSVACRRHCSSTRDRLSWHCHRDRSLVQGNTTPSLDPYLCHHSSAMCFVKSRVFCAKRYIFYRVVVCSPISLSLSTYVCVCAQNLMCQCNVCKRRRRRRRKKKTTTNEEERRGEKEEKREKMW